MPTKTPTIANKTTTPETQPAATAACIPELFDGDTVGMSNVSVKHTRKYGKCSTISNNLLFLFLNKRLVIRAGIHKNTTEYQRGKTLIRLLLQIWDCTVCLDLF